jgi:DNA-binding CsgD family transcriptional regulator
LPQLVLSEREQTVLRTLVATDPVPGTSIPPVYVLELIAQFVPCDVMGACLADNSGPVLEHVELPRGCLDAVSDGTAEHAGPLHVGRMHWSRSPLQAAACQALPPGHVDGVAVGFRNGPDSVAQIWLDRKKSIFTDRDLAMFDLLGPVVRRQLRQRRTVRLPASLTAQERRVLMRVAAGLTNAEIAEALFIAPSTVRKHLEHAYRKLGVSNRLAAVVALNGGNLAGGDLADRVEHLG